VSASLPCLPIDPHLPAIAGRVRDGNLVLVAEPGAGKTTRVPRALLEAGLARRGEIVVLEPRRLAARMAARRVAAELGERPGGRVGWQVRFEEVTGPDTRVRFVTEGLLARRLVADPSLAGVSVVVLDELHERHLHADVALALLRRLQRSGARPDLRLVAMSATLDAERVAAFLDAPVLTVSGRTFPVEVEHLERPDDRPLERLVEAAVRKACARGLHRIASDGLSHGDLLVFLPGAAEIRRAAEALEEVARAHGLDVVPLHGDLPPDAQDRAVRPGPRPKVVLSTNVAESSVTIEGVVCVIDSGLARVASHSPWSGMPRLRTEKISRASATQRAGRAGRVRAGLALRLYTRADHDQRPEHEVPEIRRADLCETALALHALGERDLAAFPWLEAPPEAALAAASSLLRRLGAVDDAGCVTPLGRAMERLPVHPRAARLALEARDAGAGARGALCAALLGERDVRAAARAGLGERAAAPGARRHLGVTDPEITDSDLLARVEAVEACEAGRAFDAAAARAQGLDVGAVQAVLRARDQLARALGVARTAEVPLEDQDVALRRATLAAFPDRVGRRAPGPSAEVVLADGGAAVLAEACGVREAPLLVVVDAEEQRGRTVARMASAIEAEWLLELFPDALRDVRLARFDAATERVEAITGLAYGAVLVDESRRGGQRTPEVSAALLAAARAAPPQRLVDVDALHALRCRAAFVAAHVPGFPVLDDAAWDAALAEACEGRTSFAELREADLLSLVLARLGPDARARLDRLAPERLALPGGRRAPVTYEPGKPPYLASRLQDFFGMTEGPRLLDGRVPLTLHLLAPNQRAVQVTSDLAGFWQRHYPALRKELMRRYPRHAWPEDPLRAAPPEPRGR
jgi:ATP-dependent helicase HrpB